MKRTFLLDTCAILFTLEPDARSKAAEAEIERVGDVLLVSPVSAWEIGMLAANGRIALMREPAAWFAAFMEDRAALAPMTPEILLAASFLPHADLRDPADRIVAATARALGCTLVTRDRPLLAYAEAGWMHALPC